MPREAPRKMRGACEVQMNEFDISTESQMAEPGITDDLELGLEGARTLSTNALGGVSPDTDNFEHRRVFAAVNMRLFGEGEVLNIGRYRVGRRLGAGGMGEV